MDDHGPEQSLPGLPELSAEQLFFLNFAQVSVFVFVSVFVSLFVSVFVSVFVHVFQHTKVWCGASRPEALQSKLKTAVHAPGKYRWANHGHSICKKYQR